MNIQHFLSRSFGVIAILLSLLALASCRGPWLQEFPAWFVAVPAAVFLLLLAAGIKLLRTKVGEQTSRTPQSKLWGFVVLLAAVLGGLLLTHFFHGDTESDKNGQHALLKMGGKIAIYLAVTGVVFLVAKLNQRRSDKKPNNFNITKNTSL